MPLNLINLMDHHEIKPNAVYTTNETQIILKVSNSTIKRMLKNGLIKANKVGGEYRILGKEILRIVSPEVEKKAIRSYLNIKRKVVDKINRW
jgi:excisionase family DNA binding protein